MDNDYLMNHILTCDFAYFCERSFRPVRVNGDRLSPSQIMSFNRVS